MYGVMISLTHRVQKVEHFKCLAEMDFIHWHYSDLLRWRQKRMKRTRHAIHEERLEQQHVKQRMEVLKVA